MRSRTVGSPTFPRKRRTRRRLALPPPVLTPACLRLINGGGPALGNRAGPRDQLPAGTSVNRWAASFTTAAFISVAPQAGFAAICSASAAVIAIGVGGLV